ncbi:hypothetical protein [Desulfofustis glycolicus]|uniref:Uncharacterized protein n=1 Tax=Desulfofustis glycolicus DSM 9705 TaxID=1121409 RepID=A0A1M5S5B1_9BACT|nr:hypothetical protein [Desulfofustis glycolicus]SHH33684.1 hypothetical protein SAMN02745124_00170 [Desulfofustis glycolicus DSM 9705]
MTTKNRAASVVHVAVVGAKSKLIDYGSLRRSYKPEQIIDGETGEITTEAVIGGRRNETIINPERNTIDLAITGLH